MLGRLLANLAAALVVLAVAMPGSAAASSCTTRLFPFPSDAQAGATITRRVDVSCAVASRVVADWIAHPRRPRLIDGWRESDGPGNFAATFRKGRSRIVIAFYGVD